MRTIILSIVLLLAGIKGLAQPHLSVVPGTPGLADTVIANSSVTYLVTVENTGNVAFIDSFDIYVGVRDSLNFIPIVAHIHNAGNQQILVGDTNTQLLTHTIDTTYFKEGNNTVVIWPVSSSSPSVDSLTFDLFVIYFTSVGEAPGMDFIKAYPNPASDYLKVVSENDIEQVRIFDLSGKLQADYKNTSVIPVAALQPGYYIIEIKDKKGKMKRIKILKD